MTDSIRYELLAASVTSAQAVVKYALSDSRGYRAILSGNNSHLIILSSPPPPLFPISWTGECVDSL